MNQDPFVAIHLGAYGWKAVYFEWNSDSVMHLPESSDYLQFATPKDALAAAREFAEGLGVELHVSPTFFRVARDPQTFQAIQGWYTCPNQDCKHAFPSKSEPTSCPQCGYEE